MKISQINMAPLQQKETYCFAYFRSSHTSLCLFFSQNLDLIECKLCINNQVSDTGSGSSGPLVRYFILFQETWNLMMVARHIFNPVLNVITFILSLRFMISKTCMTMSYFYDNVLFLISMTMSCFLFLWQCLISYFYDNVLFLISMTMSCFLCHGWLQLTKAFEIYIKDGSEEVQIVLMIKMEKTNQKLLFWVSLSGNIDLISSPCQRQCELLPSLGVRRLSFVVR